MLFLFVWVLGCCGVQFYYHFRYFRQIYTLPTCQPQDLPAVSIIVAARNEAKNLPTLLVRLCRQDYPHYEAIIINDRSTDESADILASFAKENSNIIRPLHIQSIEAGVNPKKNALQKAIAQSRYDWLLLTDADCEPPLDWIRCMMQARQSVNTKIVLGIAPLVAPAGKKNTLLSQFVQYETFYTALQYASFARAGKPYMGVGRNLLYHKALFEQIGGFGEFLHTTGGDDDLFINRVATLENVSVASQGFVYSASPVSWRAWYRQKLRHLSVGKHYKAKDQQRLAWLYASQGGFWAGFFVALFGLPAGYAWACLGLGLLRGGIFWYDYARLSKRLGCCVRLAYFPLFDALFVPYLFVVGGLSRLQKTIVWKG